MKKESFWNFIEVREGHNWQFSDYAAIHCFDLNTKIICCFSLCLHAFWTQQSKNTLPSSYRTLTNCQTLQCVNRALTMSSFFEVMLIILLRRSLFTAEFIRAFFQSSRWFKIYTKFRVESLWGEAINCITLDQKLWQWCSPNPGLWAPQGLRWKHSITPPVLMLLHVGTCFLLSLPSLRLRKGLLQSICTSAWILLRWPRIFYRAQFHTTESTAINPSLAIFRKSDCIVIISAYLYWLSLDRCLKEAKMLKAK